MAAKKAKIFKLQTTGNKLTYLQCNCGTRIYTYDAGVIICAGCGRIYTHNFTTPATYVQNDMFKCTYCDNSVKQLYPITESNLDAHKPLKIPRLLCANCVLTILNIAMHHFGELTELIEELQKIEAIESI